MITKDDWLSALKLAQAPLPGDEDAQSMQELAKIWGYELTQTKAHVSRLRREGKIRVTRKIVSRIDGTRTSVPAYVLVVAP